MKVPCGCQERKEIMFDHGKPGVVELAIIGVPIIALAAIVLWRISK